MPAVRPPEFRRRALDLVAQGNPVGQVARDLGISESCLRRWMSIDDVDAGRKEGLTSAERKELVELRRRNRVREMELEILKRASAYFARENVLPNSDPAGPRTSRPGVPRGGDLPGLGGGPVDVLRGDQAPALGSGGRGSGVDRVDRGGPRGFPWHVWGSRDPRRTAHGPGASYWP